MAVQRDNICLVGLFSDRAVAKTNQDNLGGVLLTASSEATDHLPFASLLMTKTDDPTALHEADVGAYLVCPRTIKHRELSQLEPPDYPGSIGIFTMIANPDLGAIEADRYWKDNHAPLALDIHEAMTHYYQLSVVHSFRGPTYHGFALCCFASEDDLRHRFFKSKEGEKLIAEDVAKFADTRNSPRRVIATIQAP